MLARLQAQLDHARLELQGRRLRARERAALRRLGRALAADPAGADPAAGRPELRPTLAAIADVRRCAAVMAAERVASLEGDRTDLARVAGWIAPVVVLRGLCARAVLLQRERAALRELGPHYEQLGALAARSDVGATRELADVRGALARLESARERPPATHGGEARLAWATRARTEAVGLGRAMLAQLRSMLLPKAPALAGMAMGWWIANTYTDSHVRSVLRSVGIGSGGTRVVSGSAYKAMSFWLPLLAAAMCAYLGERLAAYYRQRGGTEGVASVEAPAASRDLADAGGSTDGRTPLTPADVR